MSNMWSDLLFPLHRDFVRHQNHMTANQRFAKTQQADIWISESPASPVCQPFSHGWLLVIRFILLLPLLRLFPSLLSPLQHQLPPLFLLLSWKFCSSLAAIKVEEEECGGEG